MYFSIDNWSARIQLDGLKRTHQDAVKTRPQRLGATDKIGRIIGSPEWGDVSRQDEATMDHMHEDLVSNLQREIDLILEHPVVDDVRVACAAHGLPVL